MRPEGKSAERLPTSAAHNTIQKSGGNCRIQTGGQAQMKNVLYIIKVVALACAAGVIMTILGAFPPLSFLYNWLVGHGLQNVWVGLMAGVIAICVSLYNMHHAKKKRK